MPLQACLFDLGNVLLLFSHARMVTQIAAVCECDEQTLQQWLFTGDPLQWAYESGVIDDAGFQAALEGLLGKRLDGEQLRRATADIFTLNAEMIPVLQELRQQGLRLVLLSNTCPAHIDWARAQWPDLFALFDDLVLSYEAGAMKPAARIFEVALTRIHCPPENCFYTDDIAEYIAAGRAHGLQAEIFLSAAQCRADLCRLGVMLA